MRPFLARRQHNSPVFYIGVQGITCPNIESAAKWAWKNDLPFRRNFGLHGKTILPDLLFLRNSLASRSISFETFGLQWKSYGGDSLMIHSTAYEGELYRGQVKTGASRNAVPIPDDIVPIIEAWRQICPDTSPDALMFPTHGKGERAGSTVPRRAKSFLKWRIHPIAKKMKIPRRLVTFQVMRRTPGTDLQQHGTIKMRKESYATPASRRQVTCTCSRYRKASARQSTREHGQFWRSGGQLVSDRTMQRVPKRVPTCPNWTR
jgi:hypothetical protein